MIWYLELLNSNASFESYTLNIPLRLKQNVCSQVSDIWHRTFIYFHPNSHNVFCEKVPTQSGPVFYSASKSVYFQVRKTATFQKSHQCTLQN